MKSFLFIVGFSVLGMLAHAQPQRITVNGRITDAKGNPSVNASVAIFYNNQLLAKGETDLNGKYAIDYLNYGKITTLTVEAEAANQRGYTKKELTDIDGNSTCDFQFNDRSWRALDVRDVDHEVYIYPWNAYGSLQGNLNRIQDRMFRYPYGTFAYFKPGSFSPVFYHKKVSYTFTILTHASKPIANAYVAIQVPDDEIRWGFTDQSGRVTLHADYDKGALDGKIIIAAEGYKSRKLFFQKFNAQNTATFKLNK